MCEGADRRLKMVDGVSAGEANSELHLQHHREIIGMQEEITDDDVFKELINIVMDVFSNKTEKCMLTFELPVECGVFREISSKKLTIESGLEVSSNGSKSDMLIPQKESKYSVKSLKRRKRKMKVPIAVTSKYKMKKKYKKRLNPIVQTALHAKPGYTDLEKIFKMRLKQKRSTTMDGEYRHTGAMKTSRNVVDGWRDSAERETLLNDSNLRKETTNPPRGNTDTFSNILTEFKDVLGAVEGLAHSQEHQPRKIPFEEMSYHLEGIRYHIHAIQISLQHSKSLESLSTIPPLTSTEGSEAPKRKNKVGVRLIRIGAKMSQRSFKHKAPRSKKRLKRKATCESMKHGGLDEILEKYQRVKKEETAIVQVLLGKLGLHNDCLKHRCRKRSSRKPERGMCKMQNEQAVQTCDAAAGNGEMSEGEPNSEDIQQLKSFTNQETTNEPENNIMSKAKPKRLEQTFFSETKRSNRGINIVKHKHNMPRKNRKRREPNEKSRNTAPQRLINTEEMKDPNSESPTQVVMYKYTSPVPSERSEEILENSMEAKIASARDFIRMEPHMYSEDKLMRRIQNAAKRLQYMHSLVEKKLDRLGKQQKELNRKITGKTLGNHTPREIRTNEDNRNDVCERPEGPVLNLSTEIEQLIFQPYSNFKLDESEKHNDNFKCDKEPKGVAEVSNDEKLTRISRELGKEDVLCGRSQNYICNYMMEVHGKEFDSSQAGLVDNQRDSTQSLVGKIFSSTVLTNEFQEDSSLSGHKESSPTSPVSHTTRGNEGEIIEESLFARPHLSNKRSQKTLARKKKKRVIRTPSCVLS